MIFVINLALCSMGFTRKLWLQGVDTCENLGRESSLRFQSEGE